MKPSAIAGDHHAVLVGALTLRLEIPCDFSRCAYDTAVTAAQSALPQNVLKSLASMATGPEAHESWLRS